MRARCDWKTGGDVKGLLLAILLLTAGESAHAQAFDFFGLAMMGTPQGVAAALAQGADVNAWGEDSLTPLMRAAQYHDPRAISALLKAGADIRATNMYGWSALIFAAAFNQDPEMTTTLLQDGADINARSTAGMTALMIAAAWNQSQRAIIVMLKGGADAKAKDGGGRTAFDFAQENPNLKGSDAARQLQTASW
jgi:ankyrin repeat protein